MHTYIYSYIHLNLAVYLPIYTYIFTPSSRPIYTHVVYIGIYVYIVICTYIVYKGIYRCIFSSMCVYTKITRQWGRMLCVCLCVYVRTLERGGCSKYFTKGTSQALRFLFLRSRI